jgi:hypothetical protein
MIIKDGANRPIEPLKPLFDPGNGYPNLLPADNTAADAWGFSFEGSKLSAMTGRNLVLERFTRAPPTSGGRTAGSAFWAIRG